MSSSSAMQLESQKENTSETVGVDQNPLAESEITISTIDEKPEPAFYLGWDPSVTFSGYSFKLEDDAIDDSMGDPSAQQEHQNQQDQPDRTEETLKEKKPPKCYQVGANDPPWEHSPAGLSKKQVGFVVLGLMLGLFLASLDSTIVSTALPAIVADFGRLDLYSWVVISYLLTSTTIIPLSGRLSDIFGRKILFMSSIVVFLIGSALCGAAPDMISLIIFRGIQGIGGGALIALTLVIIGDMVSIQQRGKFAGIFGVNFAIASVLGPVLGGVITDNATWRWIFYINLPIGIVALVVLFLFLHLPTDKIKLEKKLFLSIDYFGAASLVTAIIFLLIAISLGGDTYPWDSAFIICFFVFGGLLLVLFVFIETRVKGPIISLKMLAIRNVALSNLLIFSFGWAMFGSISYLPIYFQTVRGDTPTISGLKLFPLMLGLVGTSMASGIVISKTGKYWFFPIIGGVFLILGLGLVGGLLTLDINVVLLSFYIFLIGIGIGSVIQSITIICQFSVDKPMMAVATSTVTFTRTMGGVIGVTVFGVILNRKLAELLDPSVIPLTHLGHRAIVEQLPPDVARHVLEMYTEALKVCFWASIPIVGVGFILGFFIKNMNIAQATPGQPKVEQHVDLG
eukprot:TRINITY_DN15281_c0_g1_i1.p1 TRINITY_DN15281_c0_g1~~TRINITY_DN15281_c0_g1_i1.p1  ORF type:complete len:625 (+),score=155.65 TRINITY_DN15281_c0_g1_i1:89-1963(+)